MICIQGVFPFKVRQTNAVPGFPFSDFGILVMCRYLAGLLGGGNGPLQRRCLHGATQTLLIVLCIGRAVSDRIFMNLGMTYDCGVIT
jgi:hypothetical protein